MSAVPILVLIALILTIVSLFPAASNYPLLSVAVLLLCIALYLVYPFAR